MDAFRSRLNALPQQLIDRIRVLTFTLDTNTNGEHYVRQHVNRDYKPPSIIQVDRLSRLDLAQQYYARTIFTFNFPPPAGGAIQYSNAHRRCVQWLSSVSRMYRPQLRHIWLLTGLDIDDVEQIESDSGHREVTRLDTSRSQIAEEIYTLNLGAYLANVLYLHVRGSRFNAEYLVDSFVHVHGPI